MRALREAVKAWQPLQNAALDRFAAISAAWPRVVGESVAANSRPLEFKGESLVVTTRSSAWSQQLAFLQERIIAGLSEVCGEPIGALRFRVGRLAQRGAASTGRQAPAGPRPRKRPEPAAAATPEAALQRFRRDVVEMERAHARAGWKECMACGVRTPPDARALCVPCANRRAQERQARIARLLYEAPWLHYEGVAPLIEGLSRSEYAAARTALLRRWRDALEAVRKRADRRASTRERMLASSYVLLKSEIDPEQVQPALVRGLLGDTLHDIFYGSEATK